MAMNQSVSTLTGKIKLKIVFLGNQSVGKSSVIEKYIYNRFDDSSHPTVGIDFLAKNVIHKNKNYRLQLWDTAGQQRFKSLIPSYLRDSQCALILFDVTNKASLQNADAWLSMYNQNKSPGGFTFLIGNKIDLVQDRQVSIQQGKKKAQQLGMPYYEISAKTGQNIETLFGNILQVCTQNSLQVAKFDLHKPDKVTPQIEEVQQKNQEQKQKDKDTQKQDKSVPQLKIPKVDKNDNIKLSKQKEDKKVKQKNCC